MGGVVRNTCWLLIVSMICCSAYGQTRRIDSLRADVSRPGNNDLLNSLLRLCDERNSLNPDTLLKYANSARTLAIRERDTVKTALAEYYITFHLLTEGRWDSSVAVADRQLRHLRYEGPARRPFVYFSLLKARALNNSSRVKEGLDVLYPLLSEAEKAEDTLTQISALNATVAGYVSLGQDRKAIELGYRALALAPKNLTLAQAQQHTITLNNLSLGYLHLNAGKKIQVYLDSADQLVSRSIAVSRQYGFPDAYSLGLKGTILGEEGKVKEGEAALLESLEGYRAIGNHFYIINAMSELGSFYVTTKQPEKGIAICLEGIKLAGNSRANFFLHENLAENYKLAGKYQQYGETLAKLVVLKDSMYKVNSAEAISALQTKYDVTAKENIIIRQKLDLSRKNNLINGILVSAFALVISGVVLWIARRRNLAIKMKQQQAEEKRKTLQAVMEAEENERKRIAAELHDGVAQKMVVAKMNLQTFEGYFDGFSEEQQRVFDNITTLVDESCTDVRDLSHTMMPQAFARSGLTEAVRNLLNKVPDKRLLIKFSAEGNVDSISEDKQIMLYRILQECIQNALKHARASKLDIAILADDNDIDITVEDDGVGFDTKRDVYEGVGIRNLRSRVAYLGGRLEVSSQPGAGTLVALYIPTKKT